MSDPIQAVAVDLDGELAELSAALRQAEALQIRLRVLFDRRLQAEAQARFNGWLNNSDRLRAINNAGADVGCAVRRLGVAMLAASACRWEEP